MALENFYKNLPLVRLPIHEVFSKARFADVPASWHVVMTDVKNSTDAVQEGRHNDVNLVAASSLVVALNLGRAAGIEVPFFFTGDGGTMMIPENLLDTVIEGLHIHNQNSIRNFGLELHLGHLPVQQINDAGHNIQIAKVEFSKNFNKPVVLGNGLKYAEEIIKSPGTGTNVPMPDNDDLNMEGLECRWDKIKPPIAEDEIVAEPGIMVYPNPTQGLFMLEMQLPENDNSIVNIQVIDLTGRILQTEIASITKGYLKKNMSLHINFTKGIYLLRIIAGNKTYTTRLVYEK